MSDKNQYIVSIITRFKKGTKIKFTMPYKQFMRSLKEDTKIRVNNWFETDDVLVENYKLVKITINKESGRLETAEFDVEG